MSDIDVESYKAQVFGASPATSPTQDSQPATETNTTIEAPGNADTPIVAIEPGVPSAAPILPTPEDIKDEDVYLKTNFGRESRESLKADLEQLKELREKAATPAEMTFANEESKKIYQLLSRGDNKSVSAYLQAQELLSDVDSMNPADQLKLYIKMQNPLFDDDLIQDEYSSLYKINEEDDKYIDNPLQLRKDKLRAQQRQLNDVEKAKEYFTQYKAKIELPDIAPTAPAKDEAYENWKAAQANQAAIDKNLAETYSKLVPKNATSTFKFNDEANKLAFDVAFEPDLDSFNKTVALLSSGELSADYVGQDGSPDYAKFAKDIYNGRNIEKIVSEAMVQASNATKAWFLKNQKNIGDGTQRNFSVVPQTDIDKLRSQVFGKTA